MTFIIFGGIIICVIAWFIAIVLRAVGIIDIEWHVLFFPIYAVLAVVLLFSVGVGGLLFLLDFVAK